MKKTHSHHTTPRTPSEHAHDTSHKTSRPSRKILLTIVILLILAVLISILMKTSQQSARTGDTVVVHYTGTLSDGKEFDTSRDKEPLTFTLGNGQVIQGFEDALLGMKVGEKKRITLPPEQAYGQPDEKNIREVPRDMLPQEITPKVGLPLILQMSGAIVPAVITKVNNDTITIDFNPPLAGKTLIFDIELLEIQRR